MYDKNGRLTRDGAIQVIKGGGSVSIGGRTYSTVGSLPGEADFAKGDTAAEDAARARLEQQMADTQKQLDQLNSGGAKAGGPAAPAGVRTVTGADFGPRPVTPVNAGMTANTAGTDTAETPPKGKAK